MTDALVTAAVLASPTLSQVDEEEKKQELTVAQFNAEEEEEKSEHQEEQNWVINEDPIYYRYCVGNFE